MKLIYDNINNYNDDEYADFLKLIKENKRKKILKILNENAKKRSILGEILLIKLLQELNINYNSITIYQNKYNKPYIKEINTYFNISHSFDYVICAISNKEIGVDIEKIRLTNKNIINQFATSNEINYISQNNNTIQKRIFEIFTLKEAYFKCLGTNLNYIKEIEFTITNTLVKCNEKKVKCELLYLIDNYIVATCEKIENEKGTE